MSLEQWAMRHGVSPFALAELRMLMGCAAESVAPPGGGEGGSESRQQSLVRLDAASNNVWLTRNNVGALLDARGVPVRFGLWNENKRQNATFKSSDLIGIRPVLIQAHHVGSIIGQFVARECKHETWRYKGDAHEQAQLKFIEFVVAKGGDAAFATGPGSFQPRG